MSKRKLNLTLIDLPDNDTYFSDCSASPITPYSSFEELSFTPTVFLHFYCISRGEINHLMLAIELHHQLLTP